MSKVAEQVGVIDIFRAIIMFCVNATVNIFWVLLFVLYLLYEQNKDSLVNARSTVSSSGGVVRQTSTLRQDIDNQIQRYLVLKTLISACVGGGVWLWLGLILHVRLGKVVLFFFKNNKNKKKKEIVFGYLLLWYTMKYLFKQNVNLTFIFYTFFHLNSFFFFLCFSYYSTFICIIYIYFKFYS